MPYDGREHAHLTYSEAQVLRLLVAGRSVSDIAAVRDNTVLTIRTHIRNIHSKTDTHSLSQILLWTLMHGDCCLGRDRSTRPH